MPPVGTPEILGGMTGVQVNVDNFARAETHRMFAALQEDSGGVNLLTHSRTPAPIDRQTVIRMNRDTLYSHAIVDISAGATLTVPDAGGRYLSVMVVNEDHYINRVFHEAGTYDLTVEELGSPYVAVAARTLVDPRDPGDLAAVAAVQEASPSTRPRHSRSNRRRTTPRPSTAPVAPCLPSRRT